MIHRACVMLMRRLAAKSGSAKLGLDAGFPDPAEQHKLPTSGQLRIMPDRNPISVNTQHSYGPNSKRDKIRHARLSLSAAPEIRLYLL